jgi:hypothetical protein
MSNWYRKLTTWAGTASLILSFASASGASVPRTMPDIVGLTLSEATAAAADSGILLGSINVMASESSADWNRVTSQIEAPGTVIAEGAWAQVNVAREPGAIEFEILQPIPGDAMAPGSTIVVQTNKPISWYSGASIYIPWEELHLEYWMVGGSPWYSSGYETVDTVSGDAQVFTFTLNGTLGTSPHILYANSTSRDVYGPITHFNTSETTVDGAIYGMVSVPEWANTLNVDRFSSRVHVKPWDWSQPRKLAAESGPGSFMPSHAYGLSGLGEFALSRISAAGPSGYGYEIYPVANGDYYLEANVRLYDVQKQYGRYLFATHNADTDPDPDLVTVLDDQTTINLLAKPSPHGLVQGDVYFLDGVANEFRFDTAGPPGTSTSPDIVYVQGVESDPDFVAGREGVEIVWLSQTYSLPIDFSSGDPGTVQMPPLGDPAWQSSTLDAAGYHSMYYWNSVYGVHLPDDTYAIFALTYPAAYGSKPSSDSSARPARDARESVYMGTWNQYAQFAWQPNGSRFFGTPTPNEMDMPDLIGISVQEAKDALRELATYEFDISYIPTSDVSRYGKINQHWPGPGEYVWNQEMQISLEVFAPVARDVRILSIYPAHGAVGVGTPIGEGQVEVTFTITLDSSIELVRDNDMDSPTYDQMIPNVQVDVMGVDYADSYVWNEARGIAVLKFTLNDDTVYDYSVSGWDSDGVGSELAESEFYAGSFTTGDAFVGAQLSGAYDIPGIGLPLELVVLSSTPPLTINPEHIQLVRLGLADGGQFTIAGVDSGTYWLSGLAMDPSTFDSDGIPDVYTGIYDPDGDGYANALHITGNEVLTGLDIVLTRPSMADFADLVVTEVLPHPLATDVPLSAPISVTFSDPIYVDEAGISVDAEAFPAGGVAEIPSISEDGRTLTWSTELSSDQAYVFAVWEAESYDPDAGRFESIGKPVIVPFTTGAALPDNELVVDVTVPTGVTPDVEGYVVVLLDSLPISNNLDDWNPVWIGASDTRHVRVTHAPAGTYYVGVVPYADNLSHGLYQSDGIPMVVVIDESIPTPEISVALGEGLGSGVDIAYPTPGMVNVPLDTVISITFDDYVPIDVGGNSDIELFLWPTPVEAGPSMVGEDGMTVYRNVLLDAGTTYQLLAIREMEPPITYVFGTGTELASGFVAGQLRVEVSDMFFGYPPSSSEPPADEITPTKLSREPSSEDGPLMYAVALITEFPDVLGIEASIQSYSRVAFTATGEFVVRNVPAGDYYVVGGTIGDSQNAYGELVPSIVGFLDANDDALPDMIHIAAGQAITGVEVGLDHALGWPRLISASPALFETNVPASVPTQIDLMFSSDFVPPGEGSYGGGIQILPIPLSGPVTSASFEIWSDEGGNWHMATEVILAPDMAYSVWIFDTQSSSGYSAGPTQHVFTTASEMPSGRIAGRINRGPFVPEFSDGGVFVYVGSTPGVPDVTGPEAGLALSQMTAFGLTNDQIGSYTVNYVPDGTLYPTAFAVRMGDEVTGLPTMVDYGQVDADGDGIGDAVTIDAQNRKATVNIPIIGRQSAFRLLESTPAQDALSVPTSTILSLSFNQPVFSMEQFLLDTIIISPTPVAIVGMSPGASDSILEISVTLAPNTPYDVFIPLSELGTSISAQFTTGSALGTGSISGDVLISSQIPTPAMTLVGLLTEPPSSVVLDDWSIVRIQQTYSGAYRFENLDAGTYYPLVLALVESREGDGEVVSSLDTPPLVLADAGTINGANIGLGLDNVATPPTVTQFNAAVAHLVSEVPIVGTVERFVPVISATITDPNGIGTISSVTVTLPDGSEVSVPPSADGEYSITLDPMLSFEGGTFSISATDADGASTTPVSDFVPEITLQPSVLVSPIDAATGVAPSPRLNWSDAQGAKAYVVHVSTVNPVNLANFEQGISDFLSGDNAVISWDDQILFQSQMQVPSGALSPNEEYWWVVGAVDKVLDPDQIVLSQISKFTTGSGLATTDNAAPVFGPLPAVIGVTDSAIVVTWGTDEPADSRLLYGNAINSLTDSVVSKQFTQAHVLAAKGLEPGTEYFLAVASQDYNGNRKVKALLRPVMTEAAPDNVPPIFIGGPVAEGIGQSRVTIAWVTNEPTRADVRIIGEADLDTTISSDVVKRKHSIDVLGLTAGSRYSFSVAAYDAANNGPTVAAGRSFNTRQVEDILPPRYLKAPVVVASESEAVVQWKANEPHTAEIALIGASTAALHKVIHVTEPALVQAVRISDLDPGTEYALVIRLTDVFENENRNLKPVAFRTRTVADVIPPGLISIPSIAYRSDSRIVLVWETDEPSDSYVRILQGDQPFDEYNEGALVRRHRVVITDLAAGGSYVFQIESTDAAGNTMVYPPNETPAASGRLSKVAGRSSTEFTTSASPDDLAPIMIDAPDATSSTATTFTIEWETDETANSVVYYEEIDDAPSKASRGAADPLPVNNVTQSDYITEHSSTITGLESNKSYRWVAASTDPSGNGETYSGTLSTKTAGVEDSDPPTLSDVQIIGSTDSRLTIRWNTDEPANGVVLYRPSGSADPAEEVTDADLLTEHVITITNLLASTEYELVLGSTDLVGNESSPTNVSGSTDATADVDAPMFDAVSVTVDAEQAVVRWTTDEPSDTWLDYGLSQAYGTVVSKADFTTSHELTLTNLSVATQYHFQFASADAAGNIADSISAELAFITLSEADVTPPERITGLLSAVGAYAIRLNWTANDDSLDVSGYVIERSVDGGDYAELAGSISVFSYTDKTVEIGSDYDYRIFARDVSAQGNLSDPSDTVSVSPTALDAPGAPSTAAFDSTAELRPVLEVANAVANNRAVASYSFIISTNAELTQIVTTGSNIAEGVDTTSFTVSYDLEHGQTYYWAAKALDAEGFAGPFSAAESFLVDTTFKPVSIALASFTASSVGRSVSVNWETASVDVLAFHLWRATGTEGDAFERMTSDAIVGGPSYTYADPSVVAGMTYRYQLEALLPSGGTQSFGPVHVTAAVPTMVVMSQNAPNPFNPSTSLRYQLPEQARVRLVIYNALGQQTRVLVDDLQALGFYKLTWDGLTATGKEAASGLYIARLVVRSTSGQPVEIRNIRMTMLR